LELQLDKKQQELDLLLDKIELKNNKISTLDSKINNLNLIIDSNQKQLNLQQSLSNDLKKELRVKKTSNLFYKITSIAGVLTSFILVISK
jgi:chromosome segregation ATPase